MRKPNFDYSQTMMMKMVVSVPDDANGTIVINSFDEVLQKVEKMDNLTFSAPKILYLVGWQYKGHNSKYPAFFNVNKSAVSHDKRKAFRIVNAMKLRCQAYHTTVSFHINLTDAYTNSSLWKTYYENDLLLRDKKGNLVVTGVKNGRNVYHIKAKADYESGNFQKRIDSLVAVYELSRAKTLFVDGFSVRKGLETDIAEEKKYRRKMIEYINGLGLDVITDALYRELPNGANALRGKSDLVGVVPAVWQLTMSQADYFRYPPTLLAGGELNMELQQDKDLQYLFYGNAGCESCFNLPNWTESFVREFSLKTVPYFFLSQNKLLKIKGAGKNRVAYFENGVSTAIQGKKIMQNAVVLKEGETLCLPVTWQENTYYAFSGEGGWHTFSLPNGEAELYRLEESGAVHLDCLCITNHSLRFAMQKNKGYRITYKNKSTARHAD